MNKSNIKNLDDLSILDVSKRTVAKIIKRANKGCSLCGWKEAACDIHHIIEVSEGGKNDLDNLIIVCPNHHRIIHTNYKTMESRKLLKQYSILNSFPEWKTYYNPSTDSRMRAAKHSSTGTKKCLNPDCDIIIHDFNNYCSSACYGLIKQKIVWNKDKIVELLKTYNYNLTKIGKELGLSDNAVRKYCKKNDIEFKKKRHTNNHSIRIK